MRVVISGYRYYIPEIGRWGSRDPIGVRGGLNIYNFVHNNSVCSWDYLGYSFSSYGVIALKMAENIRDGNSDVCETCCKERGLLSLENVSTATCGKFAAMIISCAYRLQGDETKADEVFNWYKTYRSGTILAQNLVQNHGWKAVYYDKDFTTHEYNWSRQEYNAEVSRRESQGLPVEGIPRPHSSNYGEDMVSRALGVRDSHSIDGISVSGAVTDFAPYNPPQNFSFPDSYKDLITMEFVYGLAGGGSHNFILSNNELYQGNTNATDVPQRRYGGFAKIVTDWTAWQAYKMAAGVLIIPPGSVPASMKKNLQDLQSRKVHPYTHVGGHL